MPLKACLAFGLFGLLVSATRAEHSDWMSKIPDETPLVSLNIPGTHNSAALHEPFPRTAQCQSMTLEEQLAAGVRFFDIRCCHQNNQFAIYHGPISQRLTFDQVLDSMEAFLRDHPRETLLVSIKQEHRPSKSTRTFSETFQSVMARRTGNWYTQQALPQLGAVRGKMVLIRRFASPVPLGIAATHWGHDGFYRNDKLFVQDRFAVPDAETKWKVISKGMEQSLRDAEQNRLHLHFTSGYTQNRLGIPNITAVSLPINRRLTDYLKSAAHRRIGCVVVDFITPEVAAAICQLNFPAEK